MNRPLILGGSVSGLATALFLARRGVPSVVLEADGEPVGPSRATRRPTPQAAHSHGFLSAGRRVLARDAPDVLEALRAAGAIEIALPGGAVSLACRRATFEAALRDAVVREPSVELRLGCPATGLLLDDARTVRGLRLGDGTAVEAAVVVDAGGRRTPVDGWLTDAGVSVDDRSVDCGIAYYSRFYRLLPEADPGPLNRWFTGGGSFDRYSCLVFPADDGTFSVTFGILPEDRALRGLRQPERFEAAARTVPVVASWLGPNRCTPLSDVALMTGMRNRVRRPRIAGLVKVGDAAATSNPAHTRGCTLALLHAREVADLLVAGPSPDALARQADHLLSDLVEPWVDDSIAQDAARLAGWRREGVAPPRLEGRVTNGQAFTAAHADPVVFEAFSQLQQLHVRHPDEVLANPDVVARVRTVLDRGFKLPALPGPDHDELAAIVGGNAVPALVG